MVRSLEVAVRGSGDLPAASAAVRGACARAGFDLRASTTFHLAVRRLLEHLLVLPGRPGLLVLKPVCGGGRVGLEAEARVVCDGRGLDVPSIEDLVDELDAGFTPEGAIRVWARKWRTVAKRRGMRPGRRISPSPGTQPC